MCSYTHLDNLDYIRSLADLFKPFATEYEKIETASRLAPWLDECCTQLGLTDGSRTRIVGLHLDGIGPVRLRDTHVTGSVTRLFTGLFKRNNLPKEEMLIPEKAIAQLISAAMAEARTRRARDNENSFFGDSYGHAHYTTVNIMKYLESRCPHLDFTPGKEAFRHNLRPVMPDWPHEGAENEQGFGGGGRVENCPF